MVDNMSNELLNSETLSAIRRYLEIQKTMAELEEERKRLREQLVKELEGRVPARWFAVVDGRKFAISHKYKVDVKYDEQLLQVRLGDKYKEILEIDAKKVRKNREIVRQLLDPIMLTIGTPTAARVKSTIVSGLVDTKSFYGAFQKTSTPFISIASVGEVVATENMPF